MISYQDPKRVKVEITFFHQLVQAFGLMIQNVFS